MYEDEPDEDEPEPEHADVASWIITNLSAAIAMKM